MYHHILSCMTTKRTHFLTFVSISMIICKTQIVFIERFLMPTSKNNVISGSHSNDWTQNFTYTYDGDTSIGRKSYYDGSVITTRYEYQE